MLVLYPLNDRKPRALDFIVCIFEFNPSDAAFVIGEHHKVWGNPIDAFTATIKCESLKFYLTWETSIVTVYAVKIALRGISPMIWRRLRLFGSTSIADLHYIIQIAMGWDNEYLLPRQQRRILLLLEKMILSNFYLS